MAHEPMDHKKGGVPADEALSETGLGEILSVDGAYSLQSDELALALEEYQPGSKEEKHLVRKMDMRLIPILWLMCVLCFIDRSNIANANAAGLSEALNLSDNNYSLVISIFFVAYVSAEVPSNLILSRCRPSWYLSGIMIAWGVLICGMSQVQSYRALLALRFVLGIIEAGFMPGVFYFMTCWYKQYEIGKRFCIFYTAVCFSGAASGLIAGAVMSGLDGAKGMPGWRWLFIIEGVVTIGVAITAILILPNYPESTSKGLNREERLLAVARIMHDKRSSAVQRGGLTLWQGAKAAAADLRVYFFILLFMLQNGATTVSYFIPTILENMGYEGTKAQWMTVPIWAVGTLSLIVFPQTSDRTKDRQWHIFGGLTVSFISAIVSATVFSDNTARYVMMCFFVGGTYMVLPMILTWASETMPLPSEKRAAMSAMVNCFGSISSIYGSYLWPSSDAPKYEKGFVTVGVFLGLGALLCSVMPLIFQLLPSFTTNAEHEVAHSQRDGPEIDE